MRDGTGTGGRGPGPEDRDGGRDRFGADQLMALIPAIEPATARPVHAHTPLYVH